MSRIITRAEWGARYGDGRYWTDLPAREVWLHHSVTIAPDLQAPYDDDDRAIRAIEDIGRNRFGEVYGFPYTWGITPVGRIYQGHHVSKTGAHTQGHNTVGRAIVLVGNYEENEPTDLQLQAAAWLLRHAHEQGWIATPEITGGHRDTKATSCPGRHAYAAIPEINRLAASGGGPVLMREDADMLRRGDEGRRVLHLQSKLHAYRDEDLEWDGVYGKNTEAAVKRFQEWAGVEADGVWTATDWAVLLQVALNNGDLGQAGSKGPKGDRGPAGPRGPKGEDGLVKVEVNGEVVAR